MISEWRSYAIEDFIPFTADVYLRLIERVNSGQWPLQLPMLIVGLAVIVLLGRKRKLSAGALLAAAWVWVGTAFLIQRYAQLTWVADYWGWAFCAQAIVLCAFAFGSKSDFRFRKPFPISDCLGLAIALYGLVAYPLLTAFAGSGWAQSESFGIHPDPTAIATLGILILFSRGWQLWIQSLIPLSWCVFSALTLSVLETSGFYILVSGIALFLVSMVWVSVSPFFERAQAQSELDSQGL
ncbi:MAG: hypothetical protein JJU20_02065 [Opitutales bacterium]|nr:hypothetical protein [Opitutales bacterium]